jgi:hypothetical protein
MGFANKHDWLMLKRYDPVKKGAVMVFDKTDCYGKSSRFYADEDPLMHAQYTFADMEYWSMRSNSVESIMVPYGYAAELYDGQRFDYNMVTVVGAPYLDKTQRMKCINLKDLRPDLTNKVSSMRVYRPFTLGPANGTWRSITASKGIKF